jgi:hypothetical protein
VTSLRGTGKSLALFYSVAPQDYGGRGWYLPILPQPKYLPDGQGVHVEEPIQVPDLQLTSSMRGAAAVPDHGEAGSLPPSSSTSQPVAECQTPLFKTDSIMRLNFPSFRNPERFGGDMPLFYIYFLSYNTLENKVGLHHTHFTVC